ncbi:MAG: CBS domain-containing protein [Deltaproteobacteria bacterium]|nr:CBS domain-containing protein [Deltaproteobacteria bacterium]MBW1747210.1 CBS domain-containing protein [Deltaproteobacteria bacterium]MBW1826078.1 CBS domain-containing protein [Deltaproteobacteria bacterium]MBW1968120.1 CBS domain-containing protein [Deltaproteobacteria bacterium]MBW2155125.1 CBS domain-containing protein [Deltaproteobacteria bacterium]
MKNKIVKDLMTPISEYETISIEANLYEAALALDKVRKDYEQGIYPHKILLISDEKGEIVGKISQLDVLRALEPKGKQIGDSKTLSRFGVSAKYLRPMLNQCEFWDKPLIDICRGAGRLKVQILVCAPAEGEYVPEDASLSEAIHQLALEHHQSLLVTRGKKIVGILRQTDMFKEVVQTLSACEL